MKKLITLSTINIENDVSETMLQILKYFLTSENSQSRYYSEHIKSYKHLKYLYPQDIPTLMREATKELSLLISTWIDDAEVIVKEISNDEDGTYNVSFSIETEKYSLARIVDGDSIEILTPRRT